jgi:hypothetical protein
VRKLQALAKRAGEGERHRALGKDRRRRLLRVADQHATARGGVHVLQEVQVITFATVLIHAP